MIVEHTENNLRIIEYNRSRYGSDFAAGMSKAFLIASEELAKEREKAKKMVEVLKDLKDRLDFSHPGQRDCIYLIKQSLTEYEKL